MHNRVSNQVLSHNETYICDYDTSQNSVPTATKLASESKEDALSSWVLGIERLKRYTSVRCSSSALDVHVRTERGTSPYMHMHAQTCSCSFSPKMGVATMSANRRR